VVGVAIATETLVPAVDGGLITESLQVVVGGHVLSKKFVGGGLEARGDRQQERHDQQRARQR
jgi:hypothetical protein